MGASLLPMEGVVDENEYRVGPGDFFTIVIGSVEGSSAAIPVSADGRLPLPEAGGVMVGGLTLADARSVALDALRTSFGNIPVDISLSQPRQFYVHVSGAVPTPGRYLSLPLGRVSSALALAFADTSRAPVTNPDMRPSMRNVSVVHRDGTEDHLDLFQYFSAGQISQNPYLQDGDVVFVPGYSPAYQSVQVDGSVPFPGGYDVRPGDNIQAVLRAAGLTQPVAHVETVRVVRTDESGAATTLYIPMVSTQRSLPASLPTPSAPKAPSLASRPAITSRSRPRRPPAARHRSRDGSTIRGPTKYNRAGSPSETSSIARAA